MHVEAAGGLLLWLGVSLLAAAAPPSARAIPPTAARADGGLTLEPESGGRLRHQAEGFTALIHPDGSVEFRDHRPRPTLSVAGFAVGRRGQKQPPRTPEPSWTSFVERASFPERVSFPGGSVASLVGVSGSFGGLSEWTRSQRQVAAKQAFLVATAGLRAQLKAAWLQARVEERLAELGGELVALWREPGVGLAERKRRVFELWDDCAESPAGAQARAKIEAYVRLVAPLGSPDAFTRAELADFNARRRSTRRFEPYGR